MVQLRPDLDFIRFQLRLLESIFDMDFLKIFPPKHPAQIHWSMCMSILEKGGLIKWNEKDEYYRKLLQMVLQSDTFITIGDGGIGELRLGNIKIYGDPAVQRKINSRLPDSSHYNPLMLELSIAAYQMRLGHKVTPLEEENKPDLSVQISGLDYPIYVECKCLESIVENRIRSTIKKANKQLKSVSEESYGVVILDISDAISRILYLTVTDETPQEVEGVIDIVRRTLSGEKNRSISRVIVRWAKAIKLESAEQKSLFLVKYGSEVNHEDVKGVKLLPGDINLYQGETLFARYILYDREAGIKKIETTDLMTICQKTFNFSNDELIDSFITCDKIERFYVDENYYLVLFAKKIQYEGKKTYSLFCGKREGETLKLYFAFRIPSKNFGSIKLLSPNEMLIAFAESYGLVNRVGTRAGKFIPYASKFISKKPFIPKLVEIENPEDHDFLQSIIFKEFPQKGGTTVKYALCFAIDTTQLLADLESL